MKKCASCTKDLPDAALHCVFCGAKQPPGPAVQQGLAKTAYGYSANEVLDQVQKFRQPPGRAASPQPPAPAYNPPPYSPPRPAPTPVAAPSAQPGAPSPQPQRFGPSAVTSVPPPGTAPPGQPYVGGPVGGFVPPSPASAPTMFVQSGQRREPAMLQPQAGQFARPPTPAAMQPTLVPQAPPPIQAPPIQPPPIQAPQQPPIMRIPAAQPPPYHPSPDIAHASRPIEPWRDSLRLMMVVWGVALLAAFATPLHISPLVFQWNAILEGAGTARLPPLVLAAVGLLSVLVAGIPMPPPARGLIATVLGLAGVVVPIALGGMPRWQVLAPMVGTLLLVPGLLVRSEYRDAALARALVTLGALGILIPMLLPQGGAIPLVNVFKALGEAPGAQKIEPALAVGLIVIVALSLLAWLPPPATGAATLWAWLLILWALVVHVTDLVGRGNLGDAVTNSPNAALVSWIAGSASAGAIALGSAYLVLVGYGLASVVGKQLE